MLLLGFGLYLASRSKDCNKNIRHLALSWIKKFLVSEEISIVRDFSSELQAGWQPCQPLVLLPFVAQVAAPPGAIWGCGLPGRGLLSPFMFGPLFSHRTAAYSMPRGSASPVFRRISVLSLRKSVRMWRREEVPLRGPLTILDWQGHNLLCHIGLGSARIPSGSSVPAAPGAGAEELAKTEDRQQEWIQLELQAWPLVETGSEGEGTSFS